MRKQQKQNKDKKEEILEQEYFENLKVSFIQYKQRQVVRLDGDIQLLNFKQVDDVLNLNINNLDIEYFSINKENLEQIDYKINEEDKKDQLQINDEDKTNSQCISKDSKQNDSQSYFDEQLKFLKQQFIYYDYFSNEQKNLISNITNNNQQQKELTNSNKNENLKYKQQKLIHQYFNKNQNFHLKLDYQQKVKKNNNQEISQNNIESSRSYSNQFQTYGQNINIFNFDLNQDIDKLQEQVSQFLRDEKTFDCIQFQLNYDITMKDLQKIDDYLLELIAFTNKTKIINISFDFSNKHHLLAALKFLLSIQNYNVIEVKYIQYYSRGNNRNRRYNHNIKQEYTNDMIELLYQTIFSQGGLQSFLISGGSLYQQQLVNALKKISPQLSYLRRLKINSYDYNQQKQSEMVSILSNFPQLNHFQSTQFSMEKLKEEDNLNNFFKNLSFINIKITSIPKQFNYKLDFTNLQVLNLSIGLERQAMTNQRLENLFVSFSRATNLQSLTFEYKLENNRQRTRNNYQDEQYYEEDYEYDEYDEQGYYQEEYEPQNEEQESGEDNDDSEEDGEKKDSKTEEEDELYEVLEIGNNNQNNNSNKNNNICRNYKFFEHFEKLNNLQKINMNIEFGEQLSSSLMTYLKRQNSLKSLEINSNSASINNQIYQVQLIDFDTMNLHCVNTRDIYEVLNSCSNMDNIKLNFQQFNINYQKINKEQNNFQFSITNNNTCIPKDYFNLQKFSLTQLQEFTCTNYQIDIIQLDYLLQSLSLSPQLQKIQLYLAFFSSSQTKELRLFKHLLSLKQLFELSVQLISGEYQKSLNSFILETKVLQTFVILKSQEHNYDYTEFMKILCQNQSIEKIIISNSIINSYYNNYILTLDELKQKNYFDPISYLIKNRQKQLARIDQLDYLDRNGLLIFLRTIQQSSLPLVFNIYDYELKEIYQNCLDKSQVIISE